MRITGTILVVLAALAAAQATELEDKILKSIQGFQQIMTEGSAALNIPVLDPVTISEEKLNINASPFKANIVVDGIKGIGASGFKITQLQQIDGTSKVNMALELPKVDVTGTYDIKGKAKIGFISVKLTGDGPLTATLQGFKVKAVADVKENSDGSIHINGIQMGDWGYDKLNVQLKNVMGGGVIGNTVNTLINTLAPTLINSNRKKINNLAETTGKDFINHYLDAVAGKTSLKKPDTSAIYAGGWTLSKEAQQILDRLALEIVIASSDNSGSARAFGNE